jgi:antitoxin component of RelBE/YafQ-DinJ toxin-antitoxin module
MKMIKVEDSVHKEAKAKAKALGMTLQGFIKMIVSKN